MKLEEQVCSLELAKRLKELGVKQESLLWWIPDRIKGFIIYNNEHDYCDDDYYSAYTVAELGMMLPECYESYKPNKGSLAYSWGPWKCSRIDDQLPFIKFANTEANARAKMMIYLLENKLMEADMNIEVVK